MLRILFVGGSRKPILGQLAIHLVGVEKLSSKIRLSLGMSFFRFVFFLLGVCFYAVAIFGCALMLRNRTSRFRFWATAAR